MAFILPQKHGPQSAADEHVHFLERVRDRVFKLTIPASQSAVKVFDYHFQTLSAVARGQLTQPVPHSDQTFPPDEFVSSLEAISQEVETLAYLQTIAYMGFLWRQIQSIGFDPVRYFVQGRLGFRFTFAHDHEVILRTALSPPIAPHLASRRRSYFQLRGCDLTPVRTSTTLI